MNTIIQMKKTNEAA